MSPASAGGCPRLRRHAQLTRPFAGPRFQKDALLLFFTFPLPQSEDLGGSWEPIFSGDGTFLNFFLGLLSSSVSGVCVGTSAIVRMGEVAPSPSYSFLIQTPPARLAHCFFSPPRAIGLSSAFSILRKVRFCGRLNPVDSHLWSPHERRVLWSISTAM